MLLKREVEDLYLKYGFEIGPSCDEYLVFFSQSGYFQNAEIVILSDSFNPDDIDKSEYENLGYSVRIKKYQDIESVHEALFDGFFGTRNSNNRLLSEYNSFCEQQSRKLANIKYEYICGSFAENGSLQGGNVIDRILEIFASESRQLIILEASAGFGKTCTSFEVIKQLVEKMPTRIPLLAELSKNRKASVFRYVLLSEIDQKFPALSSDLVTNEIQAGRIFLIIDGFDELLSKSCSTQQDAEKSGMKDAQTMLDTIAQLIPQDSKTKILLTSRKSSIFVGDAFDNWVTDHLDGCDVTRLQLTQPSLRDWIGSEKADILRTNRITLDSILNPVLLSLLRSEPIESFREKCISNDKVIDEYLDLLLQREKIRQSLPLSSDEQLSIMQDLAVQMVQYDISSEEVSFIKSLLLDIVASNLEDYLNRYDFLSDASETKPTEEEFLTKLSHHALLDRTPAQSNLIGFINEFIFGLLIARAIVDKSLSVNELTEKYLDIAVTAYSTCSLEKRKVLYESIIPVLPFQTAERRINTEMHLANKITGNYSGEYFDGVFFGRRVDILGVTTFRECIFSNCIFDHCQINTDAFKTCQFYNCSFYNNNIIPGNTLNCELIFFACSGHDSLASLASRERVIVDAGADYERIVLEQFWKPGYDTAEPHRAYTSLLRGVSSNNHQSLVDAIKSLVDKGILVQKQRVYELNFEKMDVIRSIVKR